MAEDQQVGEGVQQVARPTACLCASLHFFQHLSQDLVHLDVLVADSDFVSVETFSEDSDRCHSSAEQAILKHSKEDRHHVENHLRRFDGTWTAVVASPGCMSPKIDRTNRRTMHEDFSSACMSHKAIHLRSKSP